MLALLAMLQWAGIGGYQWLPGLVWLAIAGDDMPVAQTAAQACEAEAAAGTRPPPGSRGQPALSRTPRS